MHPSAAQLARRTAAAAVLVVALASGAAACTSHGTTTSQGTPGSSTGTRPSTGPGSSAGTGSSTSAGASHPDGTTEAGPSTGAGGAPAPDVAVPTPTDATEILPTQTPTPFKLPGLTPGPTLAPLLTGALPASATAHGELVAGFPTQAVPLPTGLTVVSSSIATEGIHLQLTVQASSTASPAKVVDQFTASLDGLGYEPASTPAVPGWTATQFIRGTDGVVLTTQEKLGGGTELVLTGTLTAG